MITTMSDPVPARETILVVGADIRGVTAALEAARAGYLNKKIGEKFSMPVTYYSQLLTVCPTAAALKRPASREHHQGEKTRGYRLEMIPRRAA